MDTRYIKRNDDGSVNFNESVNEFSVALRDWVKANEVGADALDTAIDSVFDENKDKDGKDIRLPKSGLVTLAVTRLGLNTTQIAMVTERMSKYITNNPRFLTVKGKHGGVQRLALVGQPIPAVEKKASNA